MTIIFACYPKDMAMPIFAYGKLKPLRQTRGLNQSEIAAELGISRPTYVLMEQGEKEPTLTQLYTLARLLGVDADELCANLPSAGNDIAYYAKFKELVAVCAHRGTADGRLSKTKLSLLTYLADFAWHFRASRPLTGETYRYTLRGPVADDFFRVLDELYETEAIALLPEGATLTIGSIEKPRPQFLSEDELKLVEKICTKWRAETTESILSFVRQRLAPKAGKTGEPIPYESILTENEELLY